MIRVFQRAHYSGEASGGGRVLEKGQLTVCDLLCCPSDSLQPSPISSGAAGEPHSGVERHLSLDGSLVAGCQQLLLQVILWSLREHKCRAFFTAERAFTDQEGSFVMQIQRKATIYVLSENGLVHLLFQKLFFFFSDNSKTYKIIKCYNSNNKREQFED